VRDARDIRALRERLNLSQQEFADLIGGALGRSYSERTLRKWERPSDATEPGKAVQVFLDELAVGSTDPDFAFIGPSEDPTGDADAPPGFEGLDVGDSAPGPPGGAREAQPPLTSGRGVWVKACEELWEMIAAGVGMTGAAIGSPALMSDGAIIEADKAALGAAWGKLAETNETFRRMLVGMTEGGAWLQVAMVTGTTVSKCWQNHAAYAAYNRQQAAAEADLNGHRGDPADEPVAA
jgi:transcriptional regulator with XRE-family HTH domain